jgi:site-specific DNA-methyltransferase (adenine-specific)
MREYYLDYEHAEIGNSGIVHADCFEWMGRVPTESIHAIVTDPPYGVKEYHFDQLEKRANGNGGVWRIPPSFDGHERSPLPRFTALNKAERKKLEEFFLEWGKLAFRILKPGGHLFIATNAHLSQLVFGSLTNAGFEFRSELIRLVRTLRGGDRPKNAETEFPNVCSLPRGCFEPWGILRKPMPEGYTVSQCLREYGTGGLQRRKDGLPFSDVIQNERTPQREKLIADHPSLKPQSFLRQVIHAALPLGEGIVLDPFMGSGSTIAACEVMDIVGIGVERYRDYYQMAKTAIPGLALVQTESAGFMLQEAFA